MMNVNNGKLYAVWSTDYLTTQEGLLQYIELDEEDWTSNCFLIETLIAPSRGYPALEL